MTTPAGRITEHAAFGLEIDALAEVARHCRQLPPRDLHARVDALVRFLDEEVLPHASAEEAVLYPAVGEALGAPGAVAAMARDHVEIRRFVERLRHHRYELLSQLLPAARLELEQDLYGLHAVLSLHLAKEEELYLPLVGDELHGAMRTAIDDAREADGLAADGG